MNWLPKNKQKRQQVYLTLAGTVILIVGMAFGLIRPQYAKLSAIKKQTADTSGQLKGIEASIQQAESMANQLSNVTGHLSRDEQDMATGDVYAWTIDTMRHFKVNYKVELPEIGQPSVGDVDLIAHFPYKQLKFTLRGSGYYHDIGKFIADLENKFPHMRIENLEMVPAGSDGERLLFSMDIIALVKSAS